MKAKLIVDDQFDWKFVSPETYPETCCRDKAPLLRYIGGVDISFDKKNPDFAVVSLVVLSYPDLKVVYSDYCSKVMDLPYIPGYLGFREVDLFLQLLKVLQSDAQHRHMMPQVILVDGNGILHYRGFGSACHFGVMADIPVIGVAKNLLAVDGLAREMVRDWAQKHLHKRGDTYPLIGPESGIGLGALLRSTDCAPNPIFISTGHRISIRTAVDVVCACCIHRVPEPIRKADQLSRDYIRRETN